MCSFFSHVETEVTASVVLYIIILVPLHLWLMDFLVLRKKFVIFNVFQVDHDDEQNSGNVNIFVTLRIHKDLFHIQ